VVAVSLAMARTAARQVIDERVEKDRAHALVLKGRYDEAIAIYRVLTVFNAEDANVRLQLAETFRKRGLLDSSVATYREAAELLEKQGHVARARGVLTGALRVAPGEPVLVESLRRLRTPPPPRKLELVKPPPPVVEVSDSDLIETPFDELSEEIGGECVTDPFCPIFQWLEETPGPDAPPPPFGLSTVIDRPHKPRNAEGRGRPRPSRTRR
jgi:tetratricopeptide (TPR) repeat protein